MYTPRIILLTACFLFPPAPATADSKPGDFDKVCGYFTDLRKLADVNRMTHVQRSDFIDKKMAKGLDRQSDAVVAWTAISYATPAERYELFTGSAESVLHHPWTCPSMEKWIAKTGVSE